MRGSPAWTVIRSVVRATCSSKSHQSPRPGRAPRGLADYPIPRRRLGPGRRDRLPRHRNAPSFRFSNAALAFQVMPDCRRARRTRMVNACDRADGGSRLLSSDTYRTSESGGVPPVKALIVHGTVPKRARRRSVRYSATWNAVCQKGRIDGDESLWESIACPSGSCSSTTIRNTAFRVAE